MPRVIKYFILTILYIIEMNTQISQNLKQLMPVLFVGHGSPMNAIQNNQYTETWHKLANALPKPKAIVCISAHWETKGIAATAMDKPETIHDFGGFPKKLFQYQYPAPGSPELAKNILNNLKEFNIKLDNDWGLDHGTWSILTHMYPKADIPVVQLSLNRNFSPQQHFQFAKNLRWLRKQGVLIVGSGNIIHNLGLIDWYNENSGHPWAIKMRQRSNEFLKTHQYDKLINYKQNGQEFIKAINSGEHYLPLLYVLGLQEEGEEISLFNDELSMGSLSMTGVAIADKDSAVHKISNKNESKNTQL